MDGIQHAGGGEVIGLERSDATKGSVSAKRLWGGRVGVGGTTRG